MIRILRSLGDRLHRDNRGLAAVEFALSAPVVLGMFLAGAELTNFAITKLRVSQLALHIADNGSRIGTNSLLTSPQISEAQINALLIGANLQGGGLDLAGRGRVIISSVEPDVTPTNPAPYKYKIHWQRCYGAKSWSSSYGTPTSAAVTGGIGPVGQKVTVQDGGGVIFVEVAYDYKPLISARLIPSTLIKDIAAMTVRDQRDYAGNGGTGVYNNEGVTASSCPG